MAYKTPQVVVIGGGIGGLTTAAVLAKAGLPVTVLEAHVYPGGCAGTFYHQQYYFDAGATLAGGFYEGGPMDLVAQAVGLQGWDAQPCDLAMVVHLPDGTAIPRWATPDHDATRDALLGAGSAEFWQWQTRTADALWALALQLPPWPPQTLAELTRLGQAAFNWIYNNPNAHLHPTLLQDAFRPVTAHLQQASKRLRLFVDAQLLIASQITSDYTNSLYGASALDLPRRGVVHLPGGIGHIANKLVEAINQHGGQLLFKQEVVAVQAEAGRPILVETKRHKQFPADIIIFNLPPWNVARLLGNEAPRRIRHLPAQPQVGWGAFMLYLGVEGQVIPADFPLHHQIIQQEPLGEGNSVFLSLSPAWDSGRAPPGQRAITLSTHTQLAPWWSLYQTNPEGYNARKANYIQRLLQAASRIIPKIEAGVALSLPGTPLTFQRFTRRDWGWVGGFPQINLWQNWGPRLSPALWLVGDTVFPGQSTAAVAMGGLRVARTILKEWGSF